MNKPKGLGEDVSGLLGREKKATTREKAGKWEGNRIWEQREEHDWLLCGGKGLKSLMVTQKNVKMQPHEVGGLRDPSECTRDMGGERISGFKKRNLR